MNTAQFSKKKMMENSITEGLPEGPHKITVLNRHLKRHLSEPAEEPHERC